MANFRYTKIPAKPEIIYKHIRERVVKELQVVGRSHVAEREEIVRDFEHEPKFDYEIQIKPKEIWVVVKVTNSDEVISISSKGKQFTIGDLWTGLDKTGLRHHPITPKPSNKYGRLFFVTGGKGSYKPKTVSGGRFRGPGKVVNGKLVAAKAVEHPGVKARKFTERINKELKPLFRTQAERGYRLGHQQALFRYR